MASEKRKRKSGTGKPRGRPTQYSRPLADKICELLATGKTLKRICSDERLPKESTVRGWALTDKDGFFARYARARDLGLDCMADELLDIADDGANDWTTKETRGGEISVVDHEHVQRSRLRVDTRKWYLAKLAPKRYSEKLVVDAGNDNESLKSLVQMAEKMAAQFYAKQNGDGSDSDGNSGQD